MSRLETTPQKKSQLKYRPEIDGLRAVAILSVFIFHLDHGWLPGGFVGVDIFFVISGYLISSILYYDCIAEKFSLQRFYQRRIARIFPVLFVVAFATLAGASFIYSSQDLASAGANLVAASLSLANIKYMLQGNYFAISPDAQPFLHYWSLSVEEQFYIFYPITLALIFKYGRRHLVLIFSLLSLCSFVSCVIITYVNPVWAFYLLPTRAWELFAGCLLAILPLRLANDHRVTTPSYLPALGLLLIGLSFAFLHESALFPGWQAIIPVAGAVALILPHSNSQGWVTKLLSSQIMIKIGKLSYSLYLWHWAVFSLIDYQFYLYPFGVRLAFKIILSVTLALLTFTFVENPARVWLNRPQNYRIAFVGLASILIFCVPLGLIIRNNNYVNASLADVTKGGLAYPGELGAFSVVLMGDSNGSMYGKVMKQICADLGGNLTIISVAAGDSLPQVIGDPSTLWLDSLAIVKSKKPDYLVIANHWTDKLHDHPDRLIMALNELKPHAKHIVLLNQPPILPAVASRASLRNGIRPPFFEDVETRTERQKVNDFLLSFQSDQISVVDISKYFDSEDGAILFLDEQGKLLYHDSTHLSGVGAEKIREVLKDSISQNR